jgi:serine/threonine protein phosphatase 1
VAWRASTSLAEKRLHVGKRIYAVGDIHGRADLLAALLARIDDDLTAHPTNNALQVFVGDYIDRGPSSRQVIELLLERVQQHNVVLLKGNHEDCILRFLDDPSVLADWQRIGGLNTVLSYGITPTRWSDPRSQHEIAIALNDSLPDSHRSFLDSLVLSFTCGDFFFVHAGVRPGIPINAQIERDLLWIRDEFLLYEEDFGKVVVHGHTPAPKPDVRSNRINIDTGAYATGHLTCLVLDDDGIRFL